MIDKAELKQLAEAATPGPWSYDGSYVCPARVEGGTTYVETWRSVADCAQPENTKFIAAANPAAVLDLITENDRLQHREQDLSASVKYWFHACGGKQFEAGVKRADEAASKYINEHWRKQRDQLRAEAAGLKTGYEAYERVNAELKAENEALRAKWENPDPILIQCMDSAIAEQEQLEKDARRYQWLRDKSESLHQFYLSTPIWFSGVKFSKENVDSTIDAALGQGEQS